MKWKGVKERIEREREIESQYSIFHVSVRKTELLGERERKPRTRGKLLEESLDCCNCSSELR